MRTKTLFIPVAAVLLAAGQAAAQGEEAAGQAATAEARAEAAQAAEAREAERSRKLAEAEKRMAEAAREIAELTSEQLPRIREIERRIEWMSSDRPRLGVTIGGEDDGPVEGVRVMAVTPGSAAADAGLRAGDILTAVNGESLSAEDSGAANGRLLDFMNGVEEGDVLDVEYLRDGKVGKVEVEPRPVEIHSYAFSGFPRKFDFTMPAVPAAPGVHVAPGAPGAAWGFAWLGNAWGDMELVELNEGLGKYFGTDQGVLVVNAPESDALQLEDGDVIQKIDGREPSSVRHAIRILSSYQPGESLTLEIMRDKRRRTLEVEMPDDRSSRLPSAPRPVRPAAAPVPAPAPVPPVERT